MNYKNVQTNTAFMFKISYQVNQN